MTLQVESTVKDIMARQVSRPAESFSMDTRMEDIGFQSLDVVELIFTLEETFDIEIPFNANTASEMELSTVGDVVAAVQAAIGKGRTA